MPSNRCDWRCRAKFVVDANALLHLSHRAVGVGCVGTGIDDEEKVEDNGDNPAVSGRFAPDPRPEDVSLSVADSRLRGSSDRSVERLTGQPLKGKRG